MKKIHIGSGKAYLPGFVNVDIFQNVAADVYADMMHLPFPENEFDTLYSCHVLEHQHRNMVLATLNYWKLLIKPGGTMRLAVPDFEAVAKHYTKNGDVKILMGLIFGGQDSHLNRHTVTFDEKYLTELLTKAGMVNIRRWDWRTTDHSEMDDFASCYLPHMEKDNPDAMLMSLNLEATKPL